MSQGTSKRSESNQPYHYTECGLDNVFICGIKRHVDDHGEQILHISAINNLHKVIACGIVESSAGISGKELRFLRTMMGMTQEQLGGYVHHDAQSIARWEKGKSKIQETSDMIIRMLAVEKLDLELHGSVEEMSAKCARSDNRDDIVIDGRRPPNYSLAVA